MKCDLIGSNRKFSFQVFSPKLLNSVIAFSVKLSLFTTGFLTGCAMASPPPPPPWI